MKQFIQSPLPFQGQKRKFLKQFKEKLNECPADAIYVDLFGGSGLLCRTVKDHYPTAKVIYNDYDNYSERIAAIPATNRIVGTIRKLVGDYPKDARIDGELKAQILAVIKQETGFVDYITISSSLLFSGNFATNYEQLAKASFYNVVRQSDYNADGYLDGLDIVSEDYKKVHDRYCNNANVIFLIDPPYLTTDVGTYKNYWKLGDYLDVLTVMDNQRYFYFTSNKSQIVELCQWMSNHSNYRNPFENATVSTTANKINYSSSYTDIMVFK